MSQYMTSGEFAKLCGTTKETLRHYKDMGLLTPGFEGENGYQYYDPQQFYDYYAIAIFKKAGTPLAKIKECIRHQNISAVLDTLIEQREALAKEMKMLEEMQYVVNNSIRNMKLGMAHDSESRPRTAFFEKEHLLAVPHSEFDVSKEDEGDQSRILISVLHKYKDICEKYHVQTDYQLGAVMRFDNKKITHLYTRVRKAYKNPYYIQKPAGRYLYTIQKGVWDSSFYYQTLFSHIEENHIKITGDIYAYDLAGFMINGVEENSMTMISVRLED